jgi:hypothetical protein
MSELLSMDEPRRRLAAMISALDVRYDLGDGHPLLGRRMPDLDLVSADGPLRVFTPMHDGQPVLLNLGAPGGLDIAPWSDRVRLIDAEHAGGWSFRSDHPPRRSAPAPRISLSAVRRRRGLRLHVGPTKHQDRR